MKKKKVLSMMLAVAVAANTMTISSFAQTDWPNMGPANVVTEDFMGLHRSVRDTNIRPDNILTLKSDNELLNRAFNKSVDYSYNELVVGPKQFPLDEKEGRITRHYNGEEYYTSTAVPAIWGTYHGKPGQAYRECFCARDVAHTAEAGSLLALDEENYQMLSRFASESADLYWRDVFHQEDGGWSRKSESQKWWTLWSLDFYGDAYYMDAGFQELPAPFEVLDKIWTQYRWTGDERWIDDTMLNYGMQLHSYDKFMKNHDIDGDGLADNGTNKGILPTLYEFEASGYFQKGDIDWNTLDVETQDASYPYESELVIKPDFFLNHSFYELPLTIKLIGKNSGNDAEQGESGYIVRIKNKAYDESKPAVLKTFEQMSTRNGHNYFHDVEIPVYVPDGITFEVYNATEKIDENQYTITDNGSGNCTITVKADYFKERYNEIYRTSAGIVVRFSDGTSGTVIVKMDDSTFDNNLNVVAVLKNGEDVTDTLEYDSATDMTYLDYEASELENTNYTLKIRHRNPITPKKDQSYNLQEYCRITSDMTRVTTAGDTVGTQYQALLAMANMIRARIAAGDTTFQPFHLEKGEKVNEGAPITLTEELAKEYEDRAANIRKVIETNWRDDDSQQVYARAINKLGERDMGWGHENSFFMPMKELLEPGEDTINYLNFIQKNALLDDPLNEEAITYMPESFYTHGQNVAGWQWTKVGLNRLDPAQKSEEEIIKTYPEIALMNIFNVVGLAMGVEPYAADNMVTTLPRLTSEVGWVSVENIPLGQTGREALNQDGRDSDGNARATTYSKPNVTNKFDLKHVGTTQSTLTNTGDETITWNAEFYGSYNKLYKTVDGVTTEITENIKHKDVAPASTYYTVEVKPGESITIGTQKDSNGAKPNTEGKIYLSDQQALFEGAPDSYPIQKDQTINGTALYDYTYTKHFDKGLGVKPDTTIRYLLPEGATEFQTIPTITDFQRNKDPMETQAAAEFRIYLDGELKEAVTLDGSKPTGEKISIPLAGERTLDLVVINKNSYMSESAAWLDAQVLVNGVDAFPANLPDNALFLTDIEPEYANGLVEYDKDVSDGTAINIDKHAFAKGISSRGETEVTYKLNGLYEKLDVVLGAQSTRNGTGTYKIYLNGSETPVFEESITGREDVKTAAIDLRVEGKCADEIKLVTNSSDNVNWADLILTVGEEVDLTDPAIIAKRINGVENIKLGQVKYNLPSVPSGNAENYTIEIASTSNPEVLAKDGTITLDDSEHDIAVTFRLEEKAGAKRSAETRTFVIYAPAKDKVSLTKLNWLDATTQNGQITVDKDIRGNLLKLDDTVYERGLGVPAAGLSEIYYDLNDGAYKRFTATVGAAQNSGYNDNDFFRVWVYAISENNVKTELYASPVFVKGPFENNNHMNCEQCKPEIDKYGLATMDKIDVDIPEGNKQLLIRTERIGDSFWGSCAIGDPYFYLNSPYEGKTLESFEEIAVQTVKGVKPTLPSMIKAKYEGVETLRLVRVTWDEIEESQYQAPGSFQVEGTVEGTQLRPVCTIDVKDKIIVGAENASAVTTIGTKPELPETVKVVYNDNKTGEETVTWDAMDENDWMKEGSFTVEGTVDGTTIKVVCRVRVDDPNKTLLANVTPDSEKALEAVQRGRYTINGKDYENSIFAHADSELIYTLGGAYTRFMTTVGIRGQSGSSPSNVIFRGYGIDKDGNETLLYDTNAVTSVSSFSSDENGYRYVTGDVSYDVDVDVTGFEKLKLVADTVGDPNTDHSAYGTPTLYTENSELGKGFHTVEVTVDENGGGAIWPNGRVAVNDGEEKEFTITPNPANPEKDSVKAMEVNVFKVDGKAAALTDGKYTLNVQKDSSIFVSFREEGSGPVEPEKLPFTDVEEDDWYYSYVRGVYEKEWMTGMTDTTFAPAENLSRAQFATILYRMAGCPEVSGESGFLDVKEGEFYTDAVTWAKNAGVITGYNDTCFGPDDDITREQIATLMYRYAQYQGKEILPGADLDKFPDGDKVSEFAEEAMKWCVSTGLIQGNGLDQTLAPQDKVARAVCATIILRYAENLE